MIAMGSHQLSQVGNFKHITCTTCVCICRPSIIYCFRIVKGAPWSNFERWILPTCLIPAVHGTSLGHVCARQVHKVVVLGGIPDCDCFIHVIFLGVNYWHLSAFQVIYCKLIGTNLIRLVRCRSYDASTMGTSDRHCSKHTCIRDNFTA